MKQLILPVIILIIAISCSSLRDAHKVKINDQSEEVNDSIEYELETFDAKFESWYTTQNRPSQYRGQHYYENWNQQYVSAWNYKATQSRNTFFEPIIGYEPTVDYGFELNHKLFYYFQYVENVLNIEIMPGGPKSIVF